VPLAHPFRNAQRILGALGLTRDQQLAVTGEVRTLTRGMFDVEDLVSIAVIAVWHLRQERPDARGGLMRLRVRWAVGEAVRADARAHGWGRPPAPREERFCPCGKSLGLLARRVVRYCIRCQAERGAARCRAYRERRKQDAA
jgi:hypothetical protein